MATSAVSAKILSHPEASLYVGDLHSNVTATMLLQKFSTIGPILSIRVCRDMITRRSLNYAYVNFEEPIHAKRALDTMNFDLLYGRPLRIMWSQRAPDLRKTGVGNVFIKHLDKRIDSKLLYYAFSTFGNILSCKIMRNESGESCGFGFIHFETQEAADMAINKMNGTFLVYKKIYVARFQSCDSRPDSPCKFTNVFIKNFGDELDETQLHELFSKQGEIRSFKVERDEHGNSKGFGFCCFETAEEAEQAVKTLNGYSIGNKQLYVGRFEKKHQRLSEIKRKKELKKQESTNKYQGVNLYISNLDDTIDDEQLEKEFSNNGESKGFGFVCFSTPDEAVKAIEEMNGSTLGSKTLYVGLAERKQERRMRLIKEHKQQLQTSNISSQVGLLVRPQTNPKLQQEITDIRTTKHMAHVNSVECPNSIVVVGQERLAPTVINNATLQEQKQTLEEHSFLLTPQMQEELSGKITAILLEVDKTKLHVQKSPDLLKAKIEKAIAVLQAYEAKQANAAKPATTEPTDS
ncbi:unnamed protein product [Rotaria socialis]|uniref:Polyadenylate-binding protein n=2 Tax=Rotaria socialis TaxID=392032 RepID=A0A820UE84_9BILA|nr:unnamed protein product [Rotaria socialis]CAF4155245.1 unnamed protein product [Rotaria socialis]CAF4480186.1 unnamed protein product [Rotaria socialis]